MIGELRLLTQQIAVSNFQTPGELVAHMGAMQAQDYLGAKWAIGLRVPGNTETDIDQAIIDRTIVRTWPMRGTLHFVAADDVRWMLALLAPRIIARSKTRHTELGLDAHTFLRADEALANGLQGGKQLTRKEVLALFETAGITTEGQRGYHLLGYAAQRALICLGAPRGKQQTFTLLDEWIPKSRVLARDEALAELARRYITSHGPATLQDFVWWSGLLVADARAGLAAATGITEQKIDGVTYWLPTHLPQKPGVATAAYLLPGFDEFLLGYTDRQTVLDTEHMQHVTPSKNGIFSAIIVLHGRVIGTWRRTLSKAGVTVSLSPFAPLKPVERQAIEAAAMRYAAYLNAHLVLAEQ